MIAILSLILVVTLSLLVTRIASVALAHTGLSQESAKFQARSAFTGSGFTTAESEKVVNHPVRRRIVMVLMLLGNAGFVTAVSSLMLAFVPRDDPQVAAFPKIAMLVAAIVALWSLASSSWVDRRISSWIERLLGRYTALDVRDYDALMRLSGEYQLAEIAVDARGWLCDRTLEALRLREEGIVVLGVTRTEGGWLGTPAGDTRLRSGDVLLVYARRSALQDLERRRPETGEEAHRRAIAQHRQVMAAERAAATEGDGATGP